MEGRRKLGSLVIPPFRGRTSADTTERRESDMVRRPSSHTAGLPVGTPDNGEPLWDVVEGRAPARSEAYLLDGITDESLLTHLSAVGLDSLSITEGGGAAAAAAATRGGSDTSGGAAVGRLVTAATTTTTTPTAGVGESERGESRMVCLVIPSSFLAAAHSECQHSAPEPPRAFSGRGGRVTAAVAANSPVKLRPRSTATGVAWRRLLVSPLASFLTAGRKSEKWIQLSGHKGDFLPGTAGTVLKKATMAEKHAYELLMEEGETMRQFVPLFYKEVDINGEPFIEMEDLLGHFTDPCCMDIKMGVRTFLESEVTKTTKRKDLLEKMMKLDPNEPTAEEKEHGITKLRYMTYREEMSTSKTLGFRVEGIRLAGEPPQNDFKLISTRKEVEEVIESFLPPPDSSVRRDIVDGLIGVLKELRAALEMSTFFMEHEFIGSSLLILYDRTGTKGAWMIDFGKTTKVDRPITHMKPWELGNHEDGYLLGLDALIDIFTSSRR
eukprot:m.115560 g.115560  ORF g.115560 m.115560 type:complete len:496 (-) comp10882_c1_seq2:1488-2975(-)